MEIKKPVSSVPTIIPQKDSADSEKKSGKSNSVGITSVKDSFQVVTNNNGGLFSENRLVQPTGENSGLKDLTPSEQQQASSMNYKDFLDFKSSSLFTQDNRTKYEDIKNSGLLEGLGHGKQTIDEKSKERIKGNTADDIKDLNSPMAQEQTNDGVQQLTGDTSMRDFVKQEIAERHQEFNKLGNGTPLERFAKSVDPSSNQGNTRPTGKDQIAYMQESERKNKDGSTTYIHDEAFESSGNTHVYHQEKTYNLKDRSYTVKEKETIYQKDNTKVEKESKTVTDKDKTTKNTSTTTTTKDDGSVTTTTTTTTTNKDGSKTTTTTEKTTPGGGTKSYDPENYKGNIPEVLQRTMDHLKEQAKKLRPEGGGERVLTDGGASGTPVFSGGTGNVSPRMGGITGMVGQPTQAGEEIGNGNFDGGSNADANGGAINNGENNWTGTTREDDPADVHFGPADQPKQQADSKDEESNNSFKSSLDSFRRIRA